MSWGDKTENCPEIGKDLRVWVKGRLGDSVG